MPPSEGPTSATRLPSTATTSTSSCPGRLRYSVGPYRRAAPGRGRSPFLTRRTTRRTEAASVRSPRRWQGAGSGSHPTPRVLCRARQNCTRVHTLPACMYCTGQPSTRLTGTPPSAPPRGRQLSSRRTPWTRPGSPTQTFRRAWALFPRAALTLAAGGAVGQDGAMIYGRRNSQERGEIPGNSGRETQLRTK